MKEKKMVLSVILGVAFVSLVTALVAGLVDCLTLMIDGNNLSNFSYRDNYNYFVGGLEIGVIGLGIALVIAFCCAKKKRNKIGIIMSSVLAGYFVISVIILRCFVPGQYTSSNHIIWYANEYTLFMSYITMALTVTVSAAFVCVSSVLLAKTKKAEERMQAEQEVPVEQQ